MKTLLLRWIMYPMPQKTPSSLWMKMIYILAVASLYTASMNAQNNTYTPSKANWVFGDSAWVTFAPDGTVSTRLSKMVTGEACATVANNSTGEILFYTDGNNIWDKNGVKMHNGVSVIDPSNTYQSANSSTQGVLIIPMPGNAKKYYVISGDQLEYSTSNKTLTQGTHITYTVVDMNATGSNSSIGDVDPSNLYVPLKEADGVTNLVNITEKMTAAVAANGRDYWLILHRATKPHPGGGYDITNKTFLVYSVTPAGIKFCSEYNEGSQLHTYATGTTGAHAFNNNMQGYMKISPDGTILATATLKDDAVELFKFDNTTGAISYLCKAGQSQGITIHFPYGLSFSPNSKYLYALENSHFVELGGSFTCSSGLFDDLFQIDVNTGQILNTHHLPCSTVNTQSLVTIGGGMQLATNGKIYFLERPFAYPDAFGHYYMAEPNTLSVIDNPDDPNPTIYDNGGTCITLAPGTHGITGLPNIIDAGNNAFVPCPDFTNSDIYEQDNGTTEIASSTVWTGKHYIDGQVVIDANATLDLTLVDLAFSPGSGITVHSGGGLVAHNSTFHSCAPNTWQGIVFEDGSQGDIEESQFINAEKGLDLQINTNVQITNNLFSNNRIGVFVENEGDIFTSSSPITGNTFLKDAYPIASSRADACDAIDNNYYGIYATNTNFSQKISQNNFIFDGAEVTLKFHGMVLNGCGASVSQNNFSNTFRSIENYNVGAYTAIENNNLEVTSNTGFNSRFNNDGYYQINVFNDALPSDGAPILISGNSLTSSLPISMAYSMNGIYVKMSSNTTIINNKITGFDYAITSDNGNVNNNVPTTAQNVVIDNNTIDKCLRAGISLDYPYSVSVTNNSINMKCGMETGNALASVPAVFGIFYSHNNTNEIDDPNTIISGNCIYNCHYSIYLQSAYNNVGQEPYIKNGPIVSNNFLYNYSSRGIWLIDMHAVIGTACSPTGDARNTFASNYKYLGSTVHDIELTALPGIAVPSMTIFGNEAIENGNVSYPTWAGSIIQSCSAGSPATYYHSNSVCNGGQVHRNAIDPVDNKEVFANYIQNYYPLIQNGSGYQLKSDYLDKINSIQENMRSGYIQGMMHILGMNNNFNELDKLYSNIQQESFMNIGNTSAWAKYDYNMLKVNYKEALKALYSIIPTSSNEAEMVTIDTIKCIMYLRPANNRILRDDEISVLKRIVNSSKNQIVINSVKLLLNTNHQDQVLYFDRTDVKVPASINSTLETNSINACLSIYPNPAVDEAVVTFSANPQDNMSIVLIDITGRALMNVPVKGASATVKLDLSELVAGNYVVVLAGQQGIIKTAKLVVAPK